MIEMHLNNFRDDELIFVWRYFSHLAAHIPVLPRGDVWVRRLKGKLTLATEKLYTSWLLIRLVVWAVDAARI